MNEVALDCPECGKQAQRIPDVLDAWFDSGSMPFAQWGYPHSPEAQATERAFPADFISEAIDQTRGWFYSLLAVSTLLFDQTSYRNVVWPTSSSTATCARCPTLGNVLDPFALLDRYGADPLRWFMPQPPGHRGRRGGCTQKRSRTSPGRSSSRSGTRTASSLRSSRGVRPDRGWRRGPIHWGGRRRP